MNLLEKLDALKASTGDSNASLARKAGVPVTTIYGLYQKGYANMQLSTLQALCDYFNVSLDYLAKDDKEDGTINVKLSNTETELISLYRGLNDQGRDTLLGTARGLVANPAMREDGGLNVKKTV